MEFVNLLAVAEIKNQSVKKYKGTKKYVATGDIDGREIVSCTDVNYDEKPSRANVTALKDQIIFARMQKTKKVLRVNEQTKDYIFSTGFCTLEVCEKVLSEYLELVIISDLFQRQKDKNSKGATQKAINNSGLKKIKIPLPVIGIQKKIVEVLDKAQSLIDIRKKQIMLLDDLIQSIFYSMFNSNNTDKYKIISLNKLCENIYDCPHSTPKYSSLITDYKCLKTSNLKSGYIGWDNMPYVSKEVYENRTKRYTPQIGDVVYSREGAILGIAAIINKKDQFCLGQRSMIFSLEKSKVTSEFFWMLMNSSFVKRQVELNIGGAAAPRINIKDIKNFQVFLPPIDIQNEFTKIVQKIESQKQLMEKSLMAMETNYNSLMQRAFKGELFS